MDKAFLVLALCVLAVALGLSMGTRRKCRCPYRATAERDAQVRWLVEQRPAIEATKLRESRTASPLFTQRFLIDGPEADAARARLANVSKGLHPDAGLSPSEVSLAKSGPQLSVRRPK